MSFFRVKTCDVFLFYQYCTKGNIDQLVNVENESETTHSCVGKLSDIVAISCVFGFGLDDFDSDALHSEFIGISLGWVGI